MNNELWTKIENLFHAALERAPEARQSFLDVECKGDADLRRRVEFLISQEEQAGSFLEAPAMDGSHATPPSGASAARQFGTYRVVSPLGVGGMGEVYRAHDSKLGRDVAIKVLPSGLARDPERLARFRREARTLASLNHPNIAAIYELVEESGEANCLVLELVEGEILRGPVPIATALDYAGQIADALEAAHHEKIIHRDLKPANIKVNPQGRVKVLDFGLAKEIFARDVNLNLSQTATLSHVESIAGHIIGTPPYMSPEQARGKDVDQRTDIWAFGCVLYELLTGKRAFRGETLQDTIAAVLAREPDWQALPAKTPAKIREMLRQCLQKDAALRLPTIAAARRIIEDAQRPWNRWRIAAAAAAVLATVAIGSAIWLREPPRPVDRSQWVQLTKLSDSAVQPALSPDGRMVTFIRGDSSFYGPGQIYVKTLPDVEPVQLTHDALYKMSPAFSPDGARVAYTTVDPEFRWDTWVVPVGGGEPQLLLRNASGLVWTGPSQVMFSEIRMGAHMAVVTAEDSRARQRDVFLPANNAAMAHRSYLSPDGKWVLMVEMDADHLWEPCRVIPADGRSVGHKVGPPGGGCTFGAWSPDGKWMYFTTNAIGANHIWRQRFPDGQPEQITSGPTEEVGIAMARDGRSFVTAVALKNAALWLHDANGEREISLEGNTAEARFTPDGKKLLYRIAREPPSDFAFYRDPGEIRMADLHSGRSAPLAPGFQVVDYDISVDGRQAVMETADPAGKPQLWLAPLDRSSPPRRIPNVEGGSPRFGPGDEIFFRRVDGNNGFVYRVHADGTGMRKAIEQPVLLLWAVSPDGRWISAWAPIAGDGSAAGQAFSLEGKQPILVGTSIRFGWMAGGAWFTQFGSWTSIIPLPAGQTLPRIPRGGFRSVEEIAALPGARRIEANPAMPGPSPDVYAFYRGTTQRNLYRVPIP